MLRASLLAALVLTALTAGTASAATPPGAATPIPESPDAATAPDFLGHPATQRPFAAPAIPRNPFMAPNGDSNIHVDGYQTDANTGPGPLGRSMQRASTFHSADCASVTFDSRGRIVTICVGVNGPGGGGAGLYLLDPRTLDTLASMDLPQRQPGLPLNTSPFTDFSAGGYFYLDNHDRAVVPTTTRHVLVIGETPQPGFAVQRDYDLTGAVPSGDKIISALPDSSGMIWFASTAGVVGTIDPTSGTVRSLDTHEPIGNSFAVDETGGVYVVTDAAMYRFDADGAGGPHVTWRETYPNDGKAKPGQTEIGSGTTPTVTSGGYVAITDNSDPIDVVVYRKAKAVSGSRLVCTVPVFAGGASDTDQSLVAAGDALVAENNFGYANPAATEEGRTTTGGLERVDVNPGGHGCHKVWHSDEIAPSVVPKASLANGLVYTYTHPAGDRSDPWYFTALDLRSGATVFRYRAGSGLGFNNNYAPITLGPDGTAYIGTLGGLALVRDATPPPVPVPVSSPGRRGRPRPHRRLAPLRLRMDVEGAACPSTVARVTLAGPDARRVARTDLRVSGRRARLRRRVRLGPRRRPVVVSAIVGVRDGRTVRLRRVLGACARPRFTG